MAFDGLPTKNVTVRNCRFIPFEENGNYYPAGYPLGAHAFLENNVFENITFENNYVQDCQERLENHNGGWIRFYAINNLKILIAGIAIGLLTYFVSPLLISTFNNFWPFIAIS